MQVESDFESSIPLGKIIHIITTSVGHPPHAITKPKTIIIFDKKIGLLT